MKIDENVLYSGIRKPYERPWLEAFRLAKPYTLLEQMSIEGDVLDFEDGEDL